MGTEWRDRENTGESTFRVSVLCIVQSISNKYVAYFRTSPGYPRVSANLSRSYPVSPRRVMMHDA